MGADAWTPLDAAERLRPSAAPREAGSNPAIVAPPTDAIRPGRAIDRIASDRV